MEEIIDDFATTEEEIIEDLVQMGDTVEVLLVFGENSYEKRYITLVQQTESVDNDLLSPKSKLGENIKRLLYLSKLGETKSFEGPHGDVYHCTITKIFKRNKPLELQKDIRRYYARLY